MFISVIIPTYKRAKDLKIVLDSLCEQIILPNETIIVDQSLDDETKILCSQKRYKRIWIKYFWINNKSGARARNQGIEELYEKSDIVCFFDDDVKVYPDYIKQTISFFWEYTNAYGFWWNIVNSPHTLFWRFFFFVRKHIMDWMNEDLSVIQYSYTVPIKTLVWSTMSYRKCIMDQWFRFPDWMERYSYGEDMFFSFSINQRYKDSLYYLPMAKIDHYRSSKARMISKEKIKQILLHSFIYYYNSHRKTRYWFIFLIAFIYYFFSYFNPKMIIILFLSVFKYIYINKKNILNNPNIINKFIFEKNNGKD